MHAEGGQKGARCTDREGVPGRASALVSSSSSLLRGGAFCVERFFSLLMRLFSPSTASHWSLVPAKANGFCFLLGLPAEGDDVSSSAYAITLAGRGLRRASNFFASFKQRKTGAQEAGACASWKTLSSWNTDGASAHDAMDGSQPRLDPPPVACDCSCGSVACTKSFLFASCSLVSRTSTWLPPTSESRGDSVPYRMQGGHTNCLPPHHQTLFDAVTRHYLYPM